MKGKTLISGERVHIRTLTAADEDEYLAMTRADRTYHRPWAAPPSTPKLFAAWLRRNRNDDYQTLLVCRNEDGAIVGVHNLSQIFRGNFQNAVLSYYASSKCAGRGYMTEGLRLVLRYVFGTLKLHRLEANIQPGNDRSIALVRRCGFRKEGYSTRYLKIAGRWRDHERWAITAPSGT